MSKLVFITGVSSGIGLHATRSLINNGYTVIGSVRNAVTATSLKQELGSSFIPLVFDVRDRQETELQIGTLRSLLDQSGLYALVNNAGVVAAGPLQVLPDEDFETVMDVNVLAVRRVTNLLLPWLGTDKKYSPGKIINISSVSGLFNAPYNGAYCISKHALESMTDIYRRELSMFGITVTAIEPGPIKSEIWSKSKGSLDRFASTAYGHLLANADKMIENSEKSALDTAVISNLIIRILEADAPQTRYLVHRNKWMFRILANWMPDKMADRLIAKTLAKGDNYRPV